MSVSPDVAQALAAGRPVVALESTIISHGVVPHVHAMSRVAVSRQRMAVPGVLHACAAWCYRHAVPTEPADRA